MTPERLHECLDKLRWWAPELADVMGANPRTVARWIAGKNPIPDTVGEWLEELVKVAEAPPDKPPWTPR